MRAKTKLKNKIYSAHPLLYTTTKLMCREICPEALEATICRVQAGGVPLNKCAVWMRTQHALIKAAAAHDWEDTLQCAAPLYGVSTSRSLFLSDVILHRSKGTALAYAAPSLKDDTDLVSTYVSHYGMSLKYASDRLRDDVRVVCIALEGGGSVRHASGRLRADEGVGMRAVSMDGMCLKDLDATLCDNPKVVRVAVQENGDALQHASLRLRGAKDIVLLAVASCGAALRHATDSIYSTDRRDGAQPLDEPASICSSDDESNTEPTLQPMSDFRASIMNVKVRRGGSSRACFGKKRAREIIRIALLQDGLAIQYAHPELRVNAQLGILAVNKNPDALAFVSAEVRNTKHVVLGAVRQCGQALRFASDRLRADRDVVKAAVTEDGLALAFASFELRSDAPSVSAAVQNTPKALQYATGRLRMSRPFVMSLVEKRPACLQYADPALQTNPDLLEMCRQQDPNAVPEVLTFPSIGGDEVFLHAQQQQPMLERSRRCTSFSSSTLSTLSFSLSADTETSGGGGGGGEMHPGHISLLKRGAAVSMYSVEECV